MEPKELIPRYHPMLPNPTMEEVSKFMETEAGRLAYAKFLADRKRRLALADPESGDPFQYGWDLPHWKEADQLTRKYPKGQLVLGGKRAAKSERAAWRTVQAAWHLKDSKIWCGQGSMKTSIAEQQALIYKYLPASIKARRGKARQGWAKVDYELDRGFANGVLTLPSKSQIHFITYGADRKMYEGWALGAPPTDENLETLEKMPWLMNIGAWLDEDFPIEWFETVEFRCTTNNAMWLATFSLVDGITPAVKAIRGTPRVERSAPAELLPQNRVLVDGCPPGHMPIVEIPIHKPKVSIVYFWSEFNPFPPNYENVKAIVKGKPEARVMMDAYGFGKDLKGQKYPKFSPVNVIPVRSLPAYGSNFFLTDPAGARMWASVWIRVAPGDPAKIYIYRDWPSEQSFGAWAVPAPTNSREGADGVAGPAQQSLGYGWSDYKRAWLEEERIWVPTDLLLDKTRRKSEDEVTSICEAVVEDPMHRRIIVAAYFDGEDLSSLQEPIEENLIDPRAGNDQKHTVEGATTPMNELATDHFDSNGKLIAPARFFRAASGVAISTGETAINEALQWDSTKPLCSVTNEPRLYVTENCLQVINMFSVFTGLGGEKGGWKDFNDLLRYFFTSGCEYVPQQTEHRRRSGGY